MKKLKCAPVSVIVLSLLLLTSYSSAQQWIQSMSGYERYREIAPQIRSSVKSGRLKIVWAKDGKSFEYNQDGRKYRFDIKKKKAVEIGEAKQEKSGYVRYHRRGGPARGRQFDYAVSPDKKWKAVYRNCNV